MNDIVSSWKDRHFELLCRIDEICRQCGIRMLLNEDTALEAFRKSELNDYISVVIDVTDAYRFIEAMEKQDDLGLRGMHNYYHYPEFDLRVYDPNTIDFDVRYYKNRDYSGLFVTVKFIKHIPNNSFLAIDTDRTYKTYKKYIKEKYDDEEFDRKQRRLLLFRLAGAAFSEEEFGKRVFKFLASRYSRASKRVQVGDNEFDASIFETEKEVSIRGREFFIPGRYKEYFRCLKGYYWQDAEIPKFEETRACFRDADHSWNEFREYIGYIDFDEYFENNLKAISYEPEYRDWLKEIRHDRRMVRRTHFRYVFWQKYMPMKDELIRLHEEGKTEELCRIMWDYLDQLIKFSRNKTTVFFDRDIFDIAVDTLAACGEKEVAESLEKLIPPEHLEPIRIKNSKGEYI